LLKHLVLFPLAYEFFEYCLFQIFCNTVLVVAFSNVICYVKNRRNGIRYSYTKSAVLDRLYIVVIITKIDSIARRNVKAGEQ